MGSVAVLARERHALLSADTVLGVTTTLVRPGEGDLRLYVESVAALRDLAPRVIYPGHGGPVTDPVGRMEELIAHRRQREEQVLSQLAMGATTVMDIRDALYIGHPGDAPSHSRGASPKPPQQARRRGPRHLRATASTR